MLLSPPWRGLESLITLLHELAIDIDHVIYKKKLSLWFSVLEILAKWLLKLFHILQLVIRAHAQFPALNISAILLLITLSDDEGDSREIRKKFMRTNILTRIVLLMLTDCYSKYNYCLRLRDAALWSQYFLKSISRFQSCYNKCIKLFLATGV